MTLRAGETVGRYEIRDYLGQGDYGATYRGFAEGVSQEVAIVLLDLPAEGPARGSFREQARWLVQLRHPNIHPVLDFGEHDGDPYIVQPLVQRAALADRRNRGLLGAEAALRLLRGIAAAVDYAHGQAILHGDLTPARVLLDADDRPLVTGFGMVSLGAGPAARAGGGDPLYMAPERVSRGELSADVDRYAFATIAYEVLAGVAPFERWPPEDRASAQSSATPPPASSHNPWLGEAVDAVLLRGLSKDPQGRWQSCLEMVEALQGAPASRQPEMAPSIAPGPPGPARSAPRGRAWIVAGIIGLVLLAAGITVWFLTRPASPTLSLSEVSAGPGQQVTLRASHLPASQVGSVQIQTSARTIGVFQADSGGNVLATVTIPLDTQPGDHLISLCWNGSCPLGQPLTILPGPSPSPSPTPTPAASPSPTPTPRTSPTPTSTPISPTPTPS